MFTPRPAPRLRSTIPVLIVFTVLLSWLALVSAPPATAAELPISGRVFDAAERPVVQGRVEISRLEEGPFAAPVTTAIIADGRFTVLAPSPGLWRLAVRVPGYVPAMATFEPLLGPAVLAPVYLPQDIGAAIEVLDAAGRPVTGAMIRGVPDDLGQWPKPNRPYWWPAARSGSSDGAGRLTLARGPGESLDLSLLSPDGFWLAARHQKKWRVVLPAKVEPESWRVAESLGGVFFELQPGSWRLGPSDGEGRLPPLAVDPEDQASLQGSLVLPDGRRQRADWSGNAVELRPMRAFSGRVVGAPGGRALEGVWVMRPERASEAVRTDGNGRFTLWTELAGGGEPRRRDELEILLAALDHLPGRTVLTMDGAENPITLWPAASIAGRVVDAKGQPQADVLIRTSERDPRSTYSDKLGRFYLGGLEPGREIELALEREDLRRLEIVLEPLADFERRRDLSWIMDVAPLVVGKIVDGEGRAVTGARVELDGSLLRRGGGVVPAQFSGDDDPIEVVSGQDGAFAATLTEPGWLDIRAEKEGFAPFRLNGIAIFNVQDRFDLGEIQLEPSASLVGRVLESGEDGAPIAGALVYIFPRTFDRYEELDLFLRFRDTSATSGADGRFTLADRRRGEEVDLIVEREGFLRRVVPVTFAPESVVPAPVVLDPEQTIEIRLAPAVRLGGLVVDEAGEGIPRAEIFLRPPFALDQTLRRKTRAEADGSFLFNDVPTGELELSARARGHSAGRLELELEGSRDDLVLELPTGFRVSGVVLDRDGVPVSGAAVRLRRSVDPGDAAWKHERPRLVSTVGSGRFELEGIGPGEWGVLVSREGFDVEKELSVVGDVDIEIVLDAPGEPLVGVVIDEAGQGIEGVRLQLVGESLGPSAVSRVGGAFRFHRVEAGRYRIRTAFSARRVGVPVALVEEPGEIRVDGDPSTPEAELEIRVGVGATLRGRVSGLSIHELSEVTISASGEQAIFTRRRTPVAADGTYEVDRLAAGRWRVVATLPGTGRRASGEVSIPPGEAEAGLDLDFASGFRLDGRLVAGDDPLSHVALRISDAFGLGNQARTDEAGRFTVTGLVEGPVKIVVDIEGPSFERQIELTGDIEIVVDLLE